MHLSLIAFLLPAAAPPPAVADKELDRLVRPFFATHCVSCHGPKKARGDFRVDDLIVDYGSPRIMAHWEEVMNRVNSGDMPPKGRPRPKPAEVARVAEWITSQLAEAEARRQSGDGERVSLRRLTREEYANTIRDLLGVTFDAADPTGLPEDPDWHGFQRIGSVLTLSPAHVEKYLAAAEAVLNEALPLGPRPKREVVRWNAFDLRGGSWKKYEKEYQARGIADKVRADIVPNNGALDDHTLQVKTTGDYLVRIKLSGLRPKGGRAPRLRLYDATIGRLLFERDIEAPENRPVTIEFRTHLPAGSHNIRIMNAVPGPNPEDRRSRSSEVPNAFTGLKSRVPWQMKFTDDDGEPIVPFLLLDRIDWDGPILDSWPTPAHKQVFFGGASATRTARTPDRSSPASPSARGVARPGPPSWTASSRCSRNHVHSATASRRRSRQPCRLSSSRRGSSISKKGVRRTLPGGSTTGSWRRGCRTSCGARCPTSACSTWLERARWASRSSSGRRSGGC